MKILKANAGALTNFEVLDFLQSRGAAKDSARIVVSVAQSEFKVFDYLEQSAACNQTRERITEFVKKCKKYNLAKAEILNIINIRPSSVVEIDPIIEECESRLGDSVEELVELLAEVLPAPPTQTESDDAGFEDKQEIPDGQQMETS
ncbi:DNA-directed RNA polymerase III subunit RPC9 [Camellia lanceoleosa]|uniref:DNA-directed RNA polymerase III subunit RPC9 n=1 Tax=Camellia lanceoleosa TaxID=1840588 RepID=A0ACC0H5E7_9ERIC|nr:DNA-directed RNA polymerase III subunit RPC9 [Camellia lanceoleosa]